MNMYGGGMFVILAKSLAIILAQSKSVVYDVHDKRRLLEENCDAILGGPSDHCPAEFMLPAINDQMKTPLGCPGKIKLWAHQITSRGPPS